MDDKKVNHPAKHFTALRASHNPNNTISILINILLHTIMWHNFDTITLFLLILSVVWRISFYRNMYLPKRTLQKYFIDKDHNNKPFRIILMGNNIISTRISTPTSHNLHTELPIWKLFNLLLSLLPPCMVCQRTQVLQMPTKFY